MAKRALLLVVGMLLSGCLNDGGYRIASFFFDGVPAPGDKKAGDQAAKQADAEVKAQAPDAGKTTASPAPAAPVVYSHGPYAKGSCRSCHDSTSSNALVKEGNDLCLTCHGTILTGKAVVHVAVMAGCLTCHDPHKSGIERLLVKSVPDLCLDCHARDAVEKQHGEIADCRSCHNPHESDSAALLDFN
jgi:predicted CXXCH cytochrome family protein